ncbi:MAG TPA: hypothetical protein VME18_12435 [Acidobacteriaceae bacterium]|nr:hypothetical protein [Acidobacteriaceae bacterium]
MKYTVLEQAAVEARAGMKEIDAEIDRLKARRELLEVMETVVRQLLAVAPVSSEAIPGTGSNKPGTTPDAPAADQHSFAEGLVEGESDSVRKEECLAPAPVDPALIRKLLDDR